jgi:pyrimidine deaminase RibD-like protein
MMMTAEKAMQSAMTIARRSVHQTSFLCALVQVVVRSTTQRNPAVIGTVTTKGRGAPHALAATRSIGARLDR